MTRLATYLWRSPPPTSVDETLVLEDELARLVVRRPRAVTDTVGSYQGLPTAEDRSTLLASGPGPVTFELWPPTADPGTLTLMAVADRVAETCRRTPRATVTFAVGVTDVGPDGTLGLLLMATGAGVEPVVFEIRPEASVVHLAGADGAVGWTPMPVPATGFITSQAVGIGGLGVVARLGPGAPVGTTLRVPGLEGATSVAIEVAGWLGETLPDEPMPEPFAVRTAETPIPR